MSSLQQPSRSSPAPLERSRGNSEAQKFVHRPAMIGEFRSLSRSSFDPSPLGGTSPCQPQRAMRSAEVVGCPYNPHARLQRSPPTCRRTSPARQRGRPGAEGSSKPLDVSGVDHCRGTALRASEPGSHRGLRATNDAPNHPDHPSPGIPLDLLGDQEPLRRKEAGRPGLPVRSGSRNTLKACLG